MSSTAAEMKTREMVANTSEGTGDCGVAGSIMMDTDGT